VFPGVHLEYGTAAAIARWTSQGKHIAYCLATSGEAGIDAIEPERCRPLREQEERDSAAVVGVESVEFLGHPDGMLEYGLPLRRDVARAVRRCRPEVVITGYFGESWAPGGLNQPTTSQSGAASSMGYAMPATAGCFANCSTRASNRAP